jgi:TPR repeat protein
MEQARTEIAALEEPNELLTANTAMAIAQMNISQPEAAKQIETLVTKISALETSEDQLAAYGKLTRELAPWATQEIVAAQLERIQASVLQLHYQADPVLRLVSGVEDPSGRVRVLCNLAGTLALTGDPEQSAAMLAKAQEITKDLETPGQLAPALTHLAAAQSLVGRGEEAKATLAKAMETVDGIQSVDEQTTALGALVAAVESMDNVDHMETVLAQSLKTATAIQHQAQSVMQQSLRLINRLPAGEQKAEALEQIALAIEQGGAGQFAELQFELATLHHEGRHLPKDAPRAAKWYRKAALGGHTSAQLNLAVMLLEGEGGAADPSEAFKWLTAAAGQGHADGQVALGMMLALGQGVEADLVEAHKWVTLSSKSGNQDAAAALEQLAPKLSDDQLAQSAQRVEVWESNQTPAPSALEPAPSPAPPVEPAPAEPATKDEEPTKTAGK